MTRQAGSLFFGPKAGFIYPWVTGNWYFSQPAEGATRAGVAVTAGRLYAVPIYIPQLTQIATIGLNITVLSAGNVRLGLYTDVGGYPAARQFDSGLIATGTTGDKTFAPAWTPAKIGWHWLAAVFSATPTVISNSNSTTIQLLGANSQTDTTAYNYLFTAFAFAALPDPFPGSPTYGGNQPPDICLQI